MFIVQFTVAPRRRLRLHKWLKNYKILSTVEFSSIYLNKIQNEKFYISSLLTLKLFLKQIIKFLIFGLVGTVQYYEWPK